MRGAFTTAALIAFEALAPAPLRSQQDTTRGALPTLDTVLVSAERVPMALGTGSVAVTRIGAAELARVPHATIADVLRLAPGFALVDFDGLGFDPQLMVRGFYGGGEAEYVIVLLDGKPLNQLHTGLVAWDALPPLGGVEAVEIARGSTSALYGDAAIGAVINIITRPAAGDGRARWSLGGGTFDSWQANADLGGTVARRAASLSGGIDQTDGLRTHASRTASRAHAGIALTARDAPARLTLSVRSHWRDFDEPGPLLDSLLRESRDASDVLFRFDHTGDRSHAVGLDGQSRLGSRARLGSSVTVEYRKTNAIRTLALAPGFGDTKERATTNGRTSASLQLDLDKTPLPGSDHLTVGADVSRGSSDSKYWAMITGDRDAYRAAGGARDSLDAAGDARRDAAALFVQYSVQPSAAVRLSLGARYDHLNDAFDARSPARAPRVTTSHSAVSPKAGLNVGYLQSERASGNVYVTASRSFKAPTLDQLFDQRSVFGMTISNPTLVPQSGTSVEGGLYHRASLAGAVRLAATLSAYQMDMKDELDFDVETLRYVNIGRSRHRGVEAGLALSGLGPASLFVNYTLQAVTARTGDFAGNALKAIPRHTLIGGLSVAPGSAVDARLILSHARDMYLDDANTARLPAYTRVDAHVAYRVGAVDVILEARNLLGARYSTTGFLDPSGTGEAYYYPAAGRVVHLGLRGGR
jgi:outer membrane receptor protein involved in Fe transport